MVTRREFLDTLVTGAVGLGMTAKSYSQILGANERVNFAVIGLNDRAHAHLASLKANQHSVRISHVCDVDSAILQAFGDSVKREMGHVPVMEKDFRRILAVKDVDAITIATPDHWHAPMAIAGLQAGKHVYLEKPCSHNPAEGEMLIRAQQKYQKHVQIGTQQRSSPHTIEIIDKIHGGLIGRPYFAKAWYSNARQSIGRGKEAPVPAQLDWELWQGPAPRRPYRDNVHPYNWHWFKLYGTGEALNNGTHEIDVCRWALGVDYPNRVSASGNRYQFKDDWEFYDTLLTCFEYEDKMIAWEGKSCQGLKYYDRTRGSAIMGTNGTVILDRDGYEIFDLEGNKIKEFSLGSTTSSSDLIGIDAMTDAHFANFLAAIRGSEQLHAPVSISNIATTMLHLSNIAWETKSALHLNPEDGRIKDNPDAMKKWEREYEKGWEPHV
ncbi:MAG: Gfo/Idh/MocA family oxidoreductase [Acidobacteria bacterium]|nr:Gfo/Idh/MocA family oxidoreductase [Acidobacteriota bacterium]